MPTLKIYKAQRTIKDLEVKSAEIVIDEEIPNVHTLAAADGIYALQAFCLCEALEASLPGGTFDHLLIEMMKRKVSHFKVSYKE